MAKTMRKVELTKEEIHALVKANDIIYKKLKKSGYFTAESLTSNSTEKRLGEQFGCNALELWSAMADMLNYLNSEN